MPAPSAIGIAKARVFVFNIPNNLLLQSSCKEDAVANNKFPVSVDLRFHARLCATTLSGKHLEPMRKAGGYQRQSANQRCHNHAARHRARVCRHIFGGYFGKHDARHLPDGHSGTQAAAAELRARQE